MHTYLAHAPLSGVPHTRFVRQVRSSVPSGRPLPRFCHLQCLTASQSPHETTTAEVLPVAAWARRNNLIYCSRILSNRGLLQVALVDVDRLALEGSLTHHTPGFCNWHQIPSGPILHEIECLLSSSLGDCVPVPAWTLKGQIFLFVTDIRSLDLWQHFLVGFPAHTATLVLAELRCLVRLIGLRISYQRAPRSPGITPHRGCSRSALVLGDPQESGALGRGVAYTSITKCVLDGTSFIHP